MIANHNLGLIVLMGQVRFRFMNNSRHLTTQNLFCMYTNVPDVFRRINKVDIVSNICTLFIQFGTLSYITGDEWDTELYKRG